MKPKYKKIALIVFLYIAGIGGVMWLLSNGQSSVEPTQTSDMVQPAENTQLPAMEDEYTGVPADNRYIRESAAQTAQRYEQGDGVIFLGFKECPWCQRMAPILNEAAEAENVPIYYLDIRQERESNTLSYRTILNILSPYLARSDGGDPVISVPDISFVKDGEILWRYEMESITAEERTPDQYWTEERRSRAIYNFREQMKNL